MAKAVDFQELFRSILTRKGISQVAFAKLVDDHGPNINAIAQGNRPPPLDRIVRWADALDLEKAERRWFLLAARDAHMPASVRDVIAEVEATAPLTAEALRQHAPALLEETARRVAEQSAKHTGGTPDLFLPVSGQAAACTGAHVDGETEQPPPVRIRSRWRVHVIQGSSGGDVVLPGQTVITDPALKPKRNRLVVIPSADGPILKRWGERHDDSVVVVSLDGLDPRLVPLAELGEPEVVVGVLFTDSVAS